MVLNLVFSIKFPSINMFIKTTATVLVSLAQLYGQCIKYARFGVRIPTTTKKKKPLPLFEKKKPLSLHSKFPQNIVMNFITPLTRFIALLEGFSAVTLGQKLWCIRKSLCPVHKHFTTIRSSVHV